MKTLAILLYVLWNISLTAADISKCQLDLGLVVDTTKSIKEENIPKLKAALQHLVQRFDISEDGTHISFETFDKESILRNTFNDSAYHSEQNILDLIFNSINELDMPTRLDLAFKAAKEQMFADENGLRPGVRKVMVLYTDGRSHPDTEDFYMDVLSIKMKGVRIVVVGIGPDARKPKHRRVLEFIGGKNVFYVSDYASLEDATSDIINLICPPNPCEKSKGMDVAFLVDKTKSVGTANFLLLKGFLLELTAGLQIGRESTHVGIILFAKHAKVIHKFADENLYSNEAVHRAISSIPVVLNSPTFTDKAIIAADKKLFTEAGGDRPKFPNVMIVLTDGKTNEKSKPFAEITASLKAKNVHIVAVGIGQYEDFQGQLEEIGGKNVHNASNFDELSDLFDEILAETCSVDGRFKRWSFWTECSATCGGGVQERTRTCTNPPPQGPFGEDCDGPVKETKVCNDTPCS